MINFLTSHIKEIIYCIIAIFLIVLDIYSSLVLWLGGVKFF